MALHPDTETDTEVERFLVGQAELTGELVHADLLRHRLLRSFFLAWGRSTAPARHTILAHLGGPISRRPLARQPAPQAVLRSLRRRDPQRTGESATSQRLLQAGRRTSAQPGATATQAAFDQLTADDGDPDELCR